jgi:hypothetical protein
MTFPYDFPVPLGGNAERVPFEEQALRVVPPWLRRRVGGAVMRALGATGDGLVARAVDAVGLRFPGFNPDALSLLGRDRRVIRGAGESDETYTVRLRRWRTDHKKRGGVFGLIEQLRAYYAAAPRQIDIVYSSGTRYVLGSDGTITRDTISWTPETPDEWAKVWIFFHAATDPTPLTDEEAASLIAIPAEWTAGHIKSLRVVYLWPGAALWDYPPRTNDEIATWPSVGAEVLEAT